MRHSRECKTWIDSYTRPTRCKRSPGHGGPCQPYQVIQVPCRRCGTPMDVVPGTAVDAERVCNMCVYRELRRPRPDDPTLQPTLPTGVVWPLSP